MASIAVYFDDFFNETNNYVSYSVSEIVVDEHIITSNIEQHIALIVHCVGILVISLGSSFSSSFQSEIHSDGGHFF